MTSQIDGFLSSKKLAAGIMWTGLGRGVPIIVALASTPFMLHHLGVDRWGLFTLALSVAGTFTILDLGIGAALTRALAERIGRAEECEAAPVIIAALVVLGLTSVVGTGIAIWAAPSVIHRFFKVPPYLWTESITAFRLLALAAPLIVVNGALWGVLAAYQRFRLASLVNIPINVVYYVGPMLAVAVHDNLVWVIGGLVLARLIQTIVYGWLSVRLVPALLTRPRFDPRMLRPLWRIGAWITLSNTLWPVMLYLDRFIVGAVLSLAAVAYYATALDLAMRLMMVPMVVTPVLYPAIAASYRAKPERARTLLRISALITIMITFPLCLVLAGLSNQVLSLWLGPTFAAHSKLVLTIDSIGMLFNCIALLPSAYTDAVGRPDVGAILILIQTVVFPPIIVVMVGWYGIEGAAVIWTIRSVVNFLSRALACSWVARSATSAVRRLSLVTLAGAMTLILCSAPSTLSVRLALMAVCMVAIPLLSVVSLLEGEEVTQLHRLALRYLPRLVATPPAA